MTALPYDPNHLYTVQEYAALPEDDTHRHELQEGVLVVSPSPTPLHMIVVKRLGTLLDQQLPDGLVAVPDVDVDLELGDPPSVRRPDMVVVRAAALDRVGLLRASDAVLVVEVISPESVRRDTKVKVLEYADAGIPHYWTIDPRRPVTATVYQLIEGAYEESQRAVADFVVSEPARLSVVLTALVRT